MLSPKNQATWETIFGDAPIGNATHATLDLLMDVARAEGGLGNIVSPELTVEDFQSGLVIYRDAQEVEGKGWALVYVKLSEELP